MLTLRILTMLPFGTFVDDGAAPGEGGGGGESGGGGGGSASAPAGGEEAGGGSAVPSPSDGSAPGAEVSPGSDTEWNGELESLRKEAWFQELPSERQARVEAGLRVKHRNWQRGFQGKMETVSKEKAALEQQLADARKQKDYFSELLGDTDTTTRLTGLETALAEKDAALKSKDEEIGKLNGRIKEFEGAQAERARQEVMDRHQREYKDIWDDFVEDEDFKAGKKDVAEPKGAYVDFCKLVKAFGGGVEAEKRAAKLVRAELAERKKAAEDPPAEELPASIKRMGNGGGARASDATRTPDETFEQVMARKRKEQASGQDEDDD